MKIESAVAATIMKAEKYLRDHEAYMNDARQHADAQAKTPDNTSSVNNQDDKQHRPASGKQSLIPVNDIALNTIASTLLNMRDILTQAITEADNEKQQTIQTEAIRKQELVFTYTYPPSSNQEANQDSDKNVENTNAQYTANQNIDLARVAISQVNQALQQISRSRAVLNNIPYSSSNNSIQASSMLSSILNSNDARERSQQTKQQLLAGSASSMYSQANQNPAMLYTLLR